MIEKMQIKASVVGKVNRGVTGSISYVVAAQCTLPDGEEFESSYEIPFRINVDFLRNGNQPPYATLSIHTEDQVRKTLEQRGVQVANLEVIFE